MSEENSFETETSAFNIGGETVSARDDFLKGISNIYYRVAACSDIPDNVTMSRRLEFLIKTLINTIIDPKERDRMNNAFNTLFLLEQCKRARDIRGVKSPGDLYGQLSAEFRQDALIDACTKMLGEMRNYHDKYYGFELHLQVMR
jgi:hypothetical protein